MNFIKKLINRKFLLIITILWTLCVTVSRAIRLPNNYAKSHWLLDYRFGFMKRGFVGSVCSLFTSIFGVTITSQAITVLSSIVYAAFIIFFLTLIFILLKKYNYDRNISVLVLVFVSSPFFVMSGHLFGYFDALLFVAAISSLFLIEKKHFLSAALISSMAILVHESYLLIGLPVIYLSIYLKYFQDRKWKLGKVDTLIMLLPVMTFLFLTLYGIVFVDNVTLFGQLLEYLNSYDYIYAGKKGLPYWQTIGFPELLKTQKHTILERIFQLKNITAYYPVALAILLFIHSSFKLKVFRLHSLLVVSVIFAPFLMYAVAFDVIRISLNILGVGFIVLWLMKVTRKSEYFDSPFMLVGISVLLINIFSRVILMDRQIDGFSDVQRAIFYLPAIFYVIFLVFRKEKEEITSS